MVEMVGNGIGRQKVLKIIQADVLYILAIVINSLLLLIFQSLMYLSIIYC